MDGVMVVLERQVLVTIASEEDDSRVAEIEIAFTKRREAKK